ncbi:hypothetical protein [Pseudoxanthomonas composti]|uniref:Lipoprotein n=1 Tax=Pseudoxanthomonas composti TaxID=2137479 RepID=A0A4Q1JYD2_9GAMM|nr:hypothetical protein [Pseudoxanthomonas composti]RXR07163.1 hypothetical protein EPA99_04375 [Pseudoxanthomonas composti]
MRLLTLLTPLALGLVLSACNESSAPSHAEPPPEHLPPPAEKAPPSDAPAPDASPANPPKEEGAKG